MLKAAIKFCGGCNPRFERGEVYNAIRTATHDIASFSIPQEGVHYDVLVIIRGCTGCPYLYEEIDAAHRLVCTDANELETIIQEIQKLTIENDKT